MNGLLKEKVINIKIIKKRNVKCYSVFLYCTAKLSFFVVYPTTINTNSQSLFLISQMVIKA